MQKKALDVEPFKNYLGALSEKKRDYVGKISKLGGGADPNPLLDVYIYTQKLWFFGEDQKCSWGSKMKNEPKLFLHADNFILEIGCIDLIEAISLCGFPSC